ncbi:MAG: hypothetical protein ACRCTJ_06890 [Brevinema sp.]
MKYIILLSVIFSQFIFAQENNEITEIYIDADQKITEVFKHIENGFVYERSTPKKKT